MGKLKEHIKCKRYLKAGGFLDDLGLYGKVKVKLSLCLTKHNAMKTYWGSGSIAPRILDLGTRWR
jgi:hypothetical protein